MVFDKITMKQYIETIATLLHLIKKFPHISLYACSSQPCENTAGDVRQHAHNDNSVRGLRNAAINLTLQRCLESDDTIRISASATREPKYATVVTTSLISEDEVQRIAIVANRAEQGVMSKKQGIEKTTLMWPVWMYFLKLMKEGFRETRMTCGLNLEFTENNIPNAACQGRKERIRRVP